MGEFSLSTLVVGRPMEVEIVGLGKRMVKFRQDKTLLDFVCHAYIILSGNCFIAPLKSLGSFKLNSYDQVKRKFVAEVLEG